MVSSPEFFADQANNPTNFVQTLYQDILNRAGSTAEVQGWVNILNSGATLSQVAVAFLTSTEYRTDLVNSYYAQFLRRPADPAGLVAWVGQLAAGVPDQTVLANIFCSAEGFNLWS